MAGQRCWANHFDEFGNRAGYLALHKSYMINSRQSWADRLLLSKDAREQLVFWKSCLSCFNGRPIWFSPGVSQIVYSDASLFGYGGYHEVEVGLEVVHGQWSISARCPIPFIKLQWIVC